jgi:hypothetical protein
MTRAIRQPGDAELDALLDEAGRIAGRRHAPAIVLLRLRCGRAEDDPIRHRAAIRFGLCDEEEQRAAPTARLLLVALACGAAAVMAFLPSRRQ